MKKLIIATLVTCVSAAAYAGCGIKVDVEGEISAYDEEKKVLKVGSQDITLEASATIKGPDGRRAKIEDLVGKAVVVSTDKHTKKGESVTAVKAEGEDDAPKPSAGRAMESNLLAESQEWTNAEGTKITAAVQKVEQGKVYFLMNGRTIPYDVSKLSQETIDKLKSIMAEKAAQ